MFPNWPGVSLFLLKQILVKIAALTRLNRNPKTLANKGFYTGPTFEN
jgi:hypothetical protein